MVQEEASSLGLEVVKRVIAWAVAALGLLVFLVLAGVAVMLGAVHEFHWALVLAPGVALLVSVVAWSIAALAGAVVVVVVVVARPWRMISVTDPLVALVKSSQLPGMVLSAMSAADSGHNRPPPL
jgi:hypothetical protein